MAVFAKPHAHAPEKEQILDKNQDEHRGLEQYQLIISEPEDIKKIKLKPMVNYYHSASQSFGFHLSAGYDPEIESGEPMPYLIGLAYKFKTYRKQWWVGKADLIVDGQEEGVLKFERVHLSDETTRLRWHWSYGFGLVVDADEKLALVSNYKNWGISGGVGGSWTLKPPLAVSLEVDAIVTVEYQFAWVSAGVAWDF